MQLVANKQTLVKVRLSLIVQVQHFHIPIAKAGYKVGHLRQNSRPSSIAPGGEFFFALDFAGVHLTGLLEMLVPDRA